MRIVGVGGLGELQDYLEAVRGAPGSSSLEALIAEERIMVLSNVAELQIG